MPTNKDFKRVVRDRMKKTGESYTAARSQLLHNKPTSKRRAQTARTLSAPPPADYATLAGMSDASVKKATGCTWERWVKALDHTRAYTWPHREIAKHVHEKYKIPGWWVLTWTRTTGLFCASHR